MDIIVCIKQVPDTTEIKIDPVTNTLIRSGVPSISNPFDLNAVEAALQLKEQYGGTVTAISMGPPQAKAVLKECLSLGVDKAYLISDGKFGGGDTLATSYTLSQAIKHIGKFDLILCGKQAIDGDTAQVGPEIAEHLGIPQVTYVSKIEGIENNVAKVEKEQEDCYEVIEVELPALMTVVKSINVPRYPTVRAKIQAARAEIPVLTSADFEVDLTRLGLKGSPTRVKKTFTPPRRTSGVRIALESEKESALELINKLTEAKVI